MTDNRPRHVLDGYKVLDFTQIVAGPTCTLMLAEMGADVIKVEMAPAGDPSRGAQVLINGRSGYFVQHNRGKKGICVDLKTPEGLAIIKELILQTDVRGREFRARSDRQARPRLRLGEDAESESRDVLDFRIRAERASGQRARLRLPRRGLRWNCFDGRGAGGRAVRDHDGDRRRQHRRACDGRDMRRFALPRANRTRAVSRSVSARYLFPLPRSGGRDAQSEQGSDQADPFRFALLVCGAGRDIQGQGPLHDHHRAARASVCGPVPRDEPSRARGRSTLQDERGPADKSDSSWSRRSKDGCSRCRTTTFRWRR